jgi:dienelactone hydrolase
MTQKRIAVEEIDNLVMGFQYLRGLDMVDPDRVGIGGFCVGASLATVAAQDPRIRDEVEFINFFGGYYDASDLVKSVVTGTRFYGEDVEPWNPDKLSVEVVTSHLIEGIGDPDERAVLTRVFVQGASGLNIDPENLSAEALAVYTLLNNPAIEEVDGLLAQLPKETRDSLELISPSSRIDALQARVLIMHDREDDLVPSEESRRLAEALGPDRETYYTEFSLFQHLDPTKPVSPPVYARELYKLFLHMYNVFRELS